MIGSSTPPVKEALAPRDNGLLADFFDIDGWVRIVTKALADPAAFTLCARRPRAGVIRDYDLKTVCLPRQLRLIGALATGASVKELAAI